MRSTHDLITNDFVIGLDTNTKCVYFHDHATVLYTVGRHLILYNRFTRKQKFIYQCHGSEVIQALALCPLKLLLAAAVTSKEGAFVFVFDVETLKRKKSIHLAREFGVVTKLSLSSDSKLLILGGEPDYNMTLWHLEKSPKQQASVKLATPSGKMIREASICPMDSSLVCVIGYCNVRFFRILDSTFRPITVTLGREQQNYFYHCWITKDLIVLGTDNELIVLIDFTVKYSIKLDDWGQRIGSMTSFSRGILIGGVKGSIRVYLMRSDDSNLLEFLKEENITESETAVKILAIDCNEADNDGICLTSEGRIQSFQLSSFEALDSVRLKHGNDIVPRFHTFQSQDFKIGLGEILDMGICSWKPIVATAGSDRCIIIWNYETATIQLRHKCPDEVSSIALHPCATMILLCFQNRVQMCSIHKGGLTDMWAKETEEKIGPCAFSHGGGQFVYCTGPYAHLFDTYSFNFVATLRGHSFPITSLCWRKGTHELATFGKDSVICLWNTNTGKRLTRVSDENFNFISGFMTDDWSQAYVNTSERLCQIYNFKNGTMDVFDKDVTVHALGSNVLIGASKPSDASDGEVVVVNLQPRNAQATKAYLHCKPLTCAKLCFENERLFTASSDGSLCISKLKDILVPIKHYKYNENPGPITLRDVIIRKKDVDQMDIRIKQLSNELHTMKGEHENQFKEIMKSHEGTLVKLEDELAETKKTYTERVEVEEATLNEIQRSGEKEIKSQSQQLVCSIENSRANFNKRLIGEKEKIDTLISVNDEQMKSLDEEYFDMKMQQRNIVQLTRSEYTPLIHDTKQAFEKLLCHKESMMLQHQNLMNILEEEAEREISSRLQETQLQSVQETRSLTLLKEEYDILKKKYDESYADFEEQDETLSTLRDTERTLIRDIDQLKYEAKRIRSSAETETQDMREKEECIKDLKLKVLDLERINKENSNRLQSLKFEHRDKDEMKEILCKQSRIIQEELKSLMLKKVQLEVKSKNHLNKLKAIKVECCNKARAISFIEDNLITIKLRMRTVCSVKENTTEVKRHLKALLNDYISCDNMKVDTKDISQKQLSDVDNLKKKIRKLKESHTRGLKRHEENMRRLENEGVILSKQLCDLLDREPNSTREEGNQMVAQANLSRELLSRE